MGSAGVYQIPSPLNKWAPRKNIPLSPIFKKSEAETKKEEDV